MKNEEINAVICKSAVENKDMLIIVPEHKRTKKGSVDIVICIKKDALKLCELANEVKIGSETLHEFWGNEYNDINFESKILAKNINHDEYRYIGAEYFLYINFPGIKEKFIDYIKKSQTYEIVPTTVY